MDDLFTQEPPKRGVNKGFIVGVVIAVILFAVAIGVLLRKPSMEDQTANFLQGAYREGTAEYTAYNRDILIETDQNTVESPTGLGTISMYIRGNVHNKGTRNVTALEVNVAVINQKNEVLRDKNVLVVPVQQPNLPAGETIPITLTIDGFAFKDDRANIRWKVTAIRTE